MDSLDLKISNPAKQISQPIEMKNNYSAAEKSKLAKASVDFESMLTKMMLKSMSETTGGMFGEEGLGGDIFEGIFQDEISKFIGEEQSLGVASKIFKSLTGEELDLNSLKNLERPNEFQRKAPQVNYNLKNVNGIAPSSSALSRLSNYEEIIDKYSNQFGVDKKIIKSVILAESSAKNNSISKAKAKGLMQLIDSTANEMNVRNVFNPDENIKGGTKYLSQMLEKFDGNLSKALAAYNAGPGAVQKYNGIPPYNETQNYVKKINSYIKYFEENE